MIWPQYVDLAEALLGHDSEAAKRSAISRAYYGAFNTARLWLEENVGPVANRAVHVGVWNAFADAEIASDDTRTAWEYVGELGAALRGLRNEADYDDAVNGLDHRAVAAVRRAGRILTLLPELRLAD